MNHLRFTVLILITFWASASTLFAQTVKPRFGLQTYERLFTLDGKRVEPAPKQILLHLTADVGGGPGYFADTATLRNPASYHLTKVSGGKKTPIKVAALYRIERRGDYGAIVIKPEGGHTDGAAYELWLEGSWAVENPDGGGGSFTVPSSKPLAIGAPASNAEAEYYKLVAFKNHFNVGRAEKGTALSLNARRVVDLSEQYKMPFARWDTALKGEIGLDAGKEKIYADTWSLDSTFDFSASLFEKPDGNRWPVYFSAGAHFEADRDFENIKGGGQASLKFEPQWPFRGIYKAFAAMANVDPKLEAGLAPFAEVGYQWVTNIQDKGALVDLGEQRITAKFAWELPLFRGIPMPIQEDFRVNGDIIMEFAGLYHIDSGETTDESKVTLLIAKDVREDPSPTAKTPSFSLSYSRGKATPKFENYDSIVAGFRFPF